MTIDEQVLDLLLQWEEMSAKGKKSDIRQLAAGDANLEQRLKRHLVALDRVAWLKQESKANIQQPLPFPNATQLSQRLLDIDLPIRFQMRLAAHRRTHGSKQGRYVILDNLGEGRMGQVAKSRSSKMARSRCVEGKFRRPSFDANP
ncbi:hypothetical protein LOC68_19520 [Blastopirellula sp. JC732]|uniref:Uncharacterized protein n=1 Tax=Blastopirellula sediminis TaxID=2894196 RepID=A0A9X1MS30_9BACT|nr:hypothetical protein [Blastopirellula sediminis]MCC9606112.1 hypothetical protein [Blastopirellula sediminis]MCC9630589.1 hypothetical protein [Blastopirellula sediminis]